jgi:cytidylate kinase
MAIITISRQLASLGDETANELSKLLDYRFIDKPRLEQRIKSYGLENSKFEKYDERKPAFFAALSQDRDQYLHYLKTAMLAEAGEGNCVFIGRGAFALFADIPGVLSVFLVASLDIRIGRVKNYFHCDDRRARQIIDQSDRDRVGFHRYFFDARWEDASNYHLTLNMGNLHPGVAAKIIKDLKDESMGPDSETRSICVLRDMSLGQQVVHRILYEKEIPIHFLEAAVSKGKVTLYGVANSSIQVESALSAARNLPGVSGVVSEMQVVKEYSVVP